MNTRTETPDILGNIMAHTSSAAFSQENDRGALVWLPVGRIYDNPFQPRTNYDDVDSLAESIWALKNELPATLGLQQPPVARVIVFGNDGDETAIERSRYNDPAALRRLALSDKHAVQLHFGHRRLRAWKLLRDRDPGYAEFPVLLAFADDLGMWKHVVSENAQRKDINAIEEAETLRVAVDRFHLTLEQAGQPFGYAKSTISNKLALLRLPAAVADLVRSGELTERHGRELVRLADAPARIEKLAELAVKKTLTVAQLSENVKWELEREQQEQEKARQLAKAAALLAAGYTPPGSSEPLPADRLRADLDTYQVNTLHPKDLHPCSGACPCMVAIYARFPYEHYVRMDPDTPNVILACSDRARRAALEEANAKAVQAGDATAVTQAEAQAAAQREARRAADAAVAAKEARRAAIIAEADAIWQEALPQFDRSRLWGSIDFLRYAFKRVNGWWIENTVKGAADTGALCAAILERLKEETRVYQDDAGATVYDLDKLRGVVKQLIAFSGAGRKRQRAGANEPLPAPAQDSDVCLWRFNPQTGIGPAWESSCGRVIDEEAANGNDATTCWQCGRPIRVEAKND